MDTTRRDVFKGLAAAAAIGGLAAAARKANADSVPYHVPDPILPVYITHRANAVFETLGAQTAIPSSEAAGAVAGALLDGIADALIKVGLVPDPGV